MKSAGPHLAWKNWIGGEILRNGKSINTALGAIDSGIGYVSKNRDTETLILEGTIGTNTVLPSIPALFNYGKYIFRRI